MKIQIQGVSQFFERRVVQAGRHIHALLFLFFICALVFAGFIFWQYGYRVSLQEPEVTVRSVTPKENELRALIEKAKGRDDARAAIAEKAFFDPFAQPEKTQ